MERNDTVIAEYFLALFPVLVGQDLKMCVGKDICVRVCVCVCAGEVCVSLTATSSLSPATYRENRDGTINQGHTQTHTHTQHINTRTNSLSHTHTPSLLLFSNYSRSSILHTHTHTHRLTSHYTFKRPPPPIKTIHDNKTKMFTFTQLHTHICIYTHIVKTPNSTSSVRAPIMPQEIFIRWHLPAIY